MESKKIIIIGGGGHSKVVMDAIRELKSFKIYGLTDNNLKKGTSVLGSRILGPDDVLPELFNKGIRYAFIAIGSIGDCSLRKKIYEKLIKIGFSLPYIKHPRATVSRGVQVGSGTFIAAGAVVNPGVRIGKNVIINTSSSVDHDCILGDYVHVAPGAILCGSVHVGDETHIGAGACVIEKIKIGKKSLIGAGTRVRKDIYERP